MDGKEGRRRRVHRAREEEREEEEEGTKGVGEKVVSIPRRHVQMCKLAQMNRETLSPPSSPIAVVPCPYHKAQPTLKFHFQNFG